MPRPRWSKEQELWLINSVGNGKTWAELTEEFNNTFGASKNKSTLTSYANRTLKIISGNETRFKKGNVNWNTGVKGEEFKRHFSKESWGNISAARNAPWSDKRWANFVYKSEVRSARKIKVRLPNGKLVLKEHAKWLEYYGELPPKGSIVVHLNQNDSDYSKENLYCVTREVFTGAQKGFLIESGDADQYLAAIKCQELLVALSESEGISTSQMRARLKKERN